MTLGEALEVAIAVILIDVDGYAARPRLMGPVSPTYGDRRTRWA